MLEFGNCKGHTASCSSEVLYLKALRETRKEKKKIKPFSLLRIKPLVLLLLS